MSTRAVYTFKDNNNTFHVYKHHDGYPTGAQEWISNALLYSFELPRFEAAEFACGFITGNKPQRGGVYLTPHWNCHGDIEYRYEISLKDNEIWVELYTMPDNVRIWDGRLNSFCILAEGIENDLNNTKD